MVASPSVNGQQIPTARRKCGNANEPHLIQLCSDLLLSVKDNWHPGAGPQEAALLHPRDRVLMFDYAYVSKAPSPEQVGNPFGALAGIAAKHPKVGSLILTVNFKFSFHEESLRAQRSACRQGCLGDCMPAPHH